ncbi:Vitamin B12-binding protein [Castellaniella defragrans]
MRRCGPAHRLKLSPTGDREPHGSVPVHHPVRRCRGFATCAARAALIVGCICSFAGPAARGQAPDRPRVITLSPSATELIYAAGAGADLVGTDRYSTYPPAARSLPRVGDAMQVNDEAILALRPTLVVGWQPSGDTAALATLLAGLHIPLVYANPRNLDDIPKLIRDLGKRLGTSGAANAAAHRLEQRIAALQAPAGPPRTVFIEVSADPLYTLGGDPLINDLLARVAVGRATRLRAGDRRHRRPAGSGPRCPSPVPVAPWVRTPSRHRGAQPIMTACRITRTNAAEFRDHADLRHLRQAIARYVALALQVRKPARARRHQAGGELLRPSLATQGLFTLIARNTSGGSGRSRPSSSAGTRRGSQPPGHPSFARRPSRAADPCRNPRPSR